MGQHVRLENNAAFEMAQELTGLLLCQEEARKGYFEEFYPIFLKHIREFAAKRR